MDIYLDNAASTKPKKRVVDAFVSSLEEYGNPSSIHKSGLSARKIIEKSNSIIANSLGCSSEEIYYTSGSTMSNNLAIQGFLRDNEDAVFVTSNVEHNDIIELYNWIKNDKYMLDVNSDGLVNPSQLEEIIEANKGRDILVSIQLANSESGVIQVPIKQISQIVCRYENVFLHTDATQYIPYYKVNMKEMGIDMLSMSGQKIGGIKGSGVLVIRNNVRDKVSPIIFGEQGLIGGTYATPLIASLSRAFELISYDNFRLQNKRDILLRDLESVGGVLVGSKKHRLPNNIFIRFPGIQGMTLLNLLSEVGIYIGTGSACSSESDKPSHVALALGLTEEEALECVRITISEKTPCDELAAAANTIKHIVSLL